VFGEEEKRPVAPNGKTQREKRAGRLKGQKRKKDSLG